MHTLCRPSGVPVKLTPSSYTNPAYFIFEGVSVPPRVEETPPQRRDPQVIWSGNDALQLPKVSAHPGFDRRSYHRSDFTEIEIPFILSQCSPATDFHTPQSDSSYQLFPVQNPSPVPPPPSKANLQYQQQRSELRNKHQGKMNVQDSVQPESNIRNLYMNHSAIMKEKVRRDKHQLFPARTNATQTANTRSPLPYTPSHMAHCHASASWIVNKHPPESTGDNSLTALQIAKSLSEVDFFPSAEKCQPPFRQRISCRNGPSKHGDRGYSWEKEV